LLANFYPETLFKSFSRCKSKPIALIPAVAEPPELFRFKCANDRRPTVISLTHFKRNNPLVCRVSARFNHSSTGSKQVYLARRRVYNHRRAHQLLIYSHTYIITNRVQISKFIQTVFKRTSVTACPNSQRKEKFSRLYTSQRQTPSLAQGLVLLRRVTAGRGRVPLHGPAKRNGRWPHRGVRGIFEGHA
jgi:hypothetical protein